MRTLFLLPMQTLPADTEAWSGFREEIERGRHQTRPQLQLFLALHSSGLLRSAQLGLPFRVYFLSFLSGSPFGTTNVHVVVAVPRRRLRPYSGGFCRTAREPSGVEI